MLTEGGFLAAFYTRHGGNGAVQPVCLYRRSGKAYFYYVVSIFTFYWPSLRWMVCPGRCSCLKIPSGSISFYRSPSAWRGCSCTPFSQFSWKPKNMRPMQIMRCVFSYFSTFYWCFFALVEYNIFIQVSAIATLFSCLMVSFVGAYIWSQGIPSPAISCLHGWLYGRCLHYHVQYPGTHGFQAGWVTQFAVGLTGECTASVTGIGGQYQQ